VVTGPDAEALAEHILDRLRNARMPFDLQVTASIGTCTGPLLREADWKTLYRSADAALYEAKAAGRDRARGSSTPQRFAA
jgi:GGDEF domain-containing protein